MRYTRVNFFYCALTVALLHTSLHAFEPKVKLAGRKDLVVGIESRQTVLEVSKTYFSVKTDETDDYLSGIENLTDPFSFKKDKLPGSASDNTTAKEAAEPEAVIYSDASVLDVVAANFSKRVRGAIARGDSNYLQLDGGVLLKPGSSFPVRIPQVEGQTFTLKVAEITSDGYTLQIGEATKLLNLNEESQSNSIQRYNP